MSEPYYKHLIQYIDHLIVTCGTQDRYGYDLDVNDLDDLSLGHLAALCLEYDDRDTTGCYFDEAQSTLDDDITCKLLAYLNTDTPEAMQEFAQAVRAQTIKRYKPFIQELIDQECQHYNADLAMRDEPYERLYDSA